MTSSLTVPSSGPNWSAREALKEQGVSWTNWTGNLTYQWFLPALTCQLCTTWALNHTETLKTGVHAHTQSWDWRLLYSRGSQPPAAEHMTARTEEPIPVRDKTADPCSTAPHVAWKQHIAADERKQNADDLKERFLSQMINTWVSSRWLWREPALTCFWSGSGLWVTWI